MLFTDNTEGWADRDEGHRMRPRNIQMKRMSITKILMIMPRLPLMI